MLVVDDDTRLREFIPQGLTERGTESTEACDVRLDLHRRQVFRADEEVGVSPHEFDLLLALTRAEGEVLSRSELLRSVWGMEGEPSTNLVDVHIGRLRRKLDAFGPELIKPVRGKGYRLEPAA